ncbi:hypothetical protein [uncultured phage_Deep1-GF2-KM23-C739]|uniref:Uncharacterized protein n=1 Tax=uncultured phage_Deep1-GF2-KM23-C739 TaxID=2740798 RepID=A0A1B1IVZ6_9CAUD|nr:hypothetical protein HOU05_gp28 [uncultured phage_Deep1-GF2-KM23-C739]ANS05498.1 hypothetical protein [uncultured phage_Deep1-GF2-KM23-C739]
MNKKIIKTINDIKLPVISKDLLDALDVLFPERTPPITMEYREICYRSGQRSVINFLHEKFKQQSENVLEKK